jgi:predicted alpha/beta superfamily hydrolase
MRKFLILILLNASHYCYAQYKLHLEVNVPVEYQNDSIFLAGSFNNWSPADTAFYLKPVNGKMVLEKDSVPAGIYEYKFTRGSWDKVEALENGADVKNCLLNINSDTVVQYSVAAWKDNFESAHRHHSAGINVHILDSNFHMASLGTDRRIWIYLPPDYNSGNKRYPVIYMQDGQNLFDESTSGFGEWGVDEILDSLCIAGKPAAIVIGIDKGAARMNEYNPYYFEKFGEGKGDKYISFIINELKPYVDKHYRTLISKENTIIAGSSMGGLISYYAALKYSSVFGRAGVFSPAFWTAPEILPLTDSLAPQTRGMFFFYMGELEGEDMMKNMNSIIARLGKSSNALLYTVTDPVGRHNEEAWRKWFGEFYLWVTSNGLNHIIK